ncbi:MULTISPECIES: ABC transporter permease [Nocardia]|uniref:ABC transporter permease n=1 Tax=Nocardia TaxID=1817 RepID=UPI001C4F50C9|nr:MULTISPECIES: ABC transporter permease subunit [Nocardia]
MSTALAATGERPPVSAVPARRGRGIGGHRLAGALGVAALIALWWVLAAAGVAGGTVPTPWRVLSTMWADGWGLYGPNFRVTAAGALQGFLWGNALAIGLAALIMLIPRIEPLATQLAILSYCTPLVALGPIILVVFGGRTPTVFLAAMYCFFTTMVGAVTGLRSADPASLDLVRAYGGGRWQQLYRVRAIAALPNTFAALKIAAPSAVLGAIIGEYLGGVDSGIGVALTAAQTAYNVPRTWGMALAAAALAGLGYLLVAVAARLITPWTATTEERR